ncbi:MAG: chemotaxis protein CheD [Methanomicrobiales archaeon]
MNLMPQGNDTVIIGIGEYHVGSMPMASIGLGSCVGLVIHDRKEGYGALVHIMLPASQGKSDRPGKYADTAIEVLVKELTKNGSSPANLIAKIAGGSAMFKTFSGNLNIGERNVEVIRKLLKDNNIPLKGEDVGGCVGRTIFYYPKENGKLVVKKGDGTLSEL